MSLDIKAGAMVEWSASTWPTNRSTAEGKPITLEPGDTGTVTVSELNVSMFVSVPEKEKIVYVLFDKAPGVEFVLWTGHLKVISESVSGEITGSQIRPVTSYMRLKS